jgi:hypothetical protein
MKRFIAILALVTLAAGTLLAASPPKEGAQASATSWVALIDAEKYADSWAAASTLFRTMLKAADWEMMAKQVRGQAGPLKTRKSPKVTLTKSVAGLPDGDYALVQFDSSFQRATNATETVTLMADGGKWKVAGYFIKP